MNKTLKNNLIYIESPTGLGHIISISDKYISQRDFLTIRNMTDQFILIHKNVFPRGKRKRYVSATVPEMAN